MGDAVRAFVEEGTIVGGFAEIGDTGEYNADFMRMDFVKIFEIRFPCQHRLIGNKGVGKKPQQNNSSPEASFSPFFLQEDCSNQYQNTDDRQRHGQKT